MTTAFVLSGGGSLGAVQVGMLQALLRWGARPDLVVGTSVGAVNGAWVAGHPGTAGPDGLASVWRGLRRADVFPSSPSRALAAVTGRSRAVVSPHGLRHLLAEHIQFQRLEDAPIPLHVAVADVLTGEDVLLSSGPAVDAVMASAAIPGIYPPAEAGGAAIRMAAPSTTRRSPMPSPSAPTWCGCCRPGTPMRCWRPRHPRSAWRCTG